MRKAQLHEFVTGLVASTWTGDNADVATAVLADEDAFGALAYQLQQAGGSERDGVSAAWQQMVDNLDDSALDFMAEKAANPAAFLARQVI